MWGGGVGTFTRTYRLINKETMIKGGRGQNEKEEGREFGSS